MISPPMNTNMRVVFRQGLLGTAILNDPATDCDPTDLQAMMNRLSQDSAASEIQTVAELVPTQRRGTSTSTKKYYQDGDVTALNLKAIFFSYCDNLIDERDDLCY